MSLRFCFLACLVLIVITACQTKGEDCIYLLPKGFEGNVLIIFDQNDGMDRIYENGKRLYKVDTSGVLKTKFSFNKRVHQSFFYWVDQQEKRFSLRYLLPSNINSSLAATGEVFIYNIETSKDFNVKKLEDRHAELFSVSTINHLDSIGNLRSSFIWNKLDQ